MDFRIQNILDVFRERWHEHAISNLDATINEADSEIRSQLLQSIVQLDVQKRLENKLPVDARDYAELGSKAVYTASEALQIQDATVAPSSVDERLADPKTTAPGTTVPANTQKFAGEKFLHFELLDEIARGGMGVVYKARDTKLNRVVALKMIIAGKLASDEEKFRFNVEAEAAAKLDHVGITPIYEVGEHDDQPYFAMKLVEGGSLADRLDEFTSDVKKAAQLVADIARAIHHAHQRGTLHRDLKPNNILLDESGSPLVTDFGLAKITEHDTEVTQTGVMMGTPGYMPPEQVASSKNVTTAADIYSLGAILFATLTGRPPFVGQSPMETVMAVVQQEPPKATSINSKTPLDLELIVQKCLKREPNERYASAADLASDLENWLVGEPISVKAPSVASVARQWMKRNIRLAAVSLIIGVLIALIATPICLIGFGQKGLPGGIYEQLPSAKAPPLAGLQFGLPNFSQQIGFLFVISAVFLVSSAGAISVGWLKPQSMNDAMGIGIISGIAVGVSLFLLLFGWLIGGSTASLFTNSDLSLLSSRNYGGVDADELIQWRYPDLAELTDSQRRNFLRQKIVQDSQLLVGLGNVFAAILTSMFFLPVVLAAGYYFRLQQNCDALYRRIFGHLEFVFVAVLLSLALIWLMVTMFSQILPAGTFNGPKPGFVSMIVSVLISSVAIWATWNFKHWSTRSALILLAVCYFAWFASMVLVGGDLDRDIRNLLAAKDYRGIAERLDLQTRQGGTWYGSSSSAVVMAAYAQDPDLHHRMHLKLQQAYVQREELFNFGSSPIFLETLLLTPETGQYLPELERLIEFVDRFSTEENYGTHRYQVLALAAYRAGKF